MLAMWTGPHTAATPRLLLFFPPLSRPLRASQFAEIRSRRAEAVDELRACRSSGLPETLFSFSFLSFFSLDELSPGKGGLRDGYSFFFLFAVFGPRWEARRTTSSESISPFPHPLFFFFSFFFRNVLPFFYLFFRGPRIYRQFATERVK